VDNDQFNINLRKYLKKVGISSQREIENAVRLAHDGGDISGNENLAVKMTLSIAQLKLSVEIDGKISLV
jgi:hypothetical protein